MSVLRLRESMPGFAAWSAAKISNFQVGLAQKDLLVLGLHVSLPNLGVA